MDSNADVAGVEEVEQYLAKLPEHVRAALLSLRETIRAAAPNATERIGYGMPTFQQSGGLVGYAAFANHCSFYPMSPDTQAMFAEELRDFETSKGTIRFTVEHPLPAELVTRIVQARVLENERG